MKIIILVEGRSEKLFKDALVKFLEPRLSQRMPKIEFQAYDGRIPKEDKLRRVIHNYSKESDAVIALTDVYTGTDDFKDAKDAKDKMRQWVGENDKFYPHAAQYDFEAWLLPFWPTIQKLAKHNQKAPSGAPETVNHSDPPAHRINKLFELGKCRDSYSKPRDAKRILKENDLLISANQCPELKSLLNTILKLCGGSTLP